MAWDIYTYIYIYIYEGNGSTSCELETFPLKPSTERCISGGPEGAKETLNPKPYTLNPKTLKPEP